MSGVVFVAVPWSLTDIEFNQLLAAVEEQTSRVDLSGIPPLSFNSTVSQIVSGMGSEWTGIYDDFLVARYQVETPGFTETVIRAQSLMFDTMRRGGIEPEVAAHMTDCSQAGFVYVIPETMEDVVAALRQPPCEGIAVVAVMPRCGSRQVKHVDVNNFLHKRGILVKKNNGVIVWEETLAYYSGNGQVRVNLLGREPQGVVTPGDEYDSVCKALASILREELVDEVSGLPILAGVWQKEELFDNQGEYYPSAPDLVVTFTSGYSPSPASKMISVRDEYLSPSLSSEVTFDGTVLLASGDMFVKGPLASSSTLNVLPTILHLLGLAVPHTSPGKTIEDLIRPEYRALFPVEYERSDALSASEEDMLLERLKALGYLE